LKLGVGIRRASRAEILRAFEVALEAIRTDRVRTRAALVALAISMAIVVCLTTLVERGRAATIRSLERAGLKNLYLVARRETRARTAPLSAADAGSVGRIAPARFALLMRLERRAMTLQGVPFQAPLYAVSGSLADLFGARARSGRLLADLDMARKSPYCLIGSDVGKTAGLAAAVGTIVAAGNRSYEIVGELAPTVGEGASAGEIPALDWNRAIVVPLGAEPDSSPEADARYPIDLAVVRLSSAGEADRTASLLERIDPQRYGPAGSVRIASPVQTLRQYKQTRRTFDRIVWLVGLLTAVSAVLGISNLLSASVTARTREIGLRRAVGARANDIILQFQAEGLLLGVLGGGLGLLSGLAISLATLERSGSGLSLSLFSFSGLAGLCIAIGLLTGLRPSQRAARIDPAQALREG
jgi:putative ABC transport system permease protein